MKIILKSGVRMNDQSSWDYTTEVGVRMRKKISHGLLPGRLKSIRLQKNTKRTVALEIMNNP